MKPKIRFKGFEGGWKAEELAHVCSVNRGVRVTRNDLHNNGIYPVYQNTDYPMGYYTKFNVESNNPFVIVGGSAGLIGFCHTNFWAADDCVFFGDNPIINKSFLYNNLIFHKTEIKRNVRGASVPRLDRETLRKLPVSIPSLPEQQEIASYFTSLDSQISASTSRLASLKQMKAASLQAMFPQEGETVPKIRFKGFEGEWRTCPLYHFAKKRTEKNTKMLYNITLTNSAEFGIIDQRNFFDHEISNSENINGYYVVRDHDFVYNPRISSSAPVGPINQNKLGYTGVMSPLYLVFEINGINRDFLEIFFHTTLWHKYMFDNGNTGARFDRLAISDEDFMKMPIPDIDFGEQQAIASYFTSLDRQISLQSQRLEKLKQIKSACLDKMFV